jgi:hypothetical protein
MVLRLLPPPPPAPLLSRRPRPDVPHASLLPARIPQKTPPPAPTAPHLLPLRPPKECPMNELLTRGRPPAACALERHAGARNPLRHTSSSGRPVSGCTVPTSFVNAGWQSRGSRHSRRAGLPSACASLYLDGGGMSPVGSRILGRAAGRDPRQSNSARSQDMLTTRQNRTCHKTSTKPITPLRINQPPLFPSPQPMRRHHA